MGIACPEMYSKIDQPSQRCDVLIRASVAGSAGGSVVAPTVFHGHAAW